MKAISYFVVGLLIISGFAALGIGQEASERPVVSKQTFLEPAIIEKNDFVRVQLEGIETYNHHPGQPLVPVKIEKYILPFGATVESIDCVAKDVSTKVLAKQLEPGPAPVIKSTATLAVEEELSQDIYTSNAMYPEKWYDYEVNVGLDSEMNHKTFVTVRTYPVRYLPATNTIKYAKELEISLNYNAPDSDPFTSNAEFDMLIITPENFVSDLEPLVTHKNSYGVQTTIKTLDEIYSSFNGVDEPEEMKYAIKDAIETMGVKYVLLVGGLKNIIWAKPRDDRNKGVSGWRCPVRYSNLDEGEPGYVCDLYFADIYKEGGEFDNWDSNGNGIFAERKGIRRDKLDMYPDVLLGRLACRNNNEVKSVVDKIINYESGPANPSWFEKMISVGGDGFLDQDKLDIKWNTNSLPDGEYTIYAQSKNPDGDLGPVEEIQVTLQKSGASDINFNHDDHLRITSWPGDPMAEIVSVSDGDTLGDDKVFYNPAENEAYCNDFTGWGRVDYENGVLTINGKSYDPVPYGIETTFKVWIENSAGQEVFSKEISGLEMYFEGEWSTGEIPLLGRAGGPYYMPSSFQKQLLFSSNGQWNGQSEVIDAISAGAGFVFFSGHGSPNVWSNHRPGIPGNRKNAEVEGLWTIDIKFPLFPMEKLSNNYKNPVLVVGGCHNSMFNVSLIPCLLDRDNSDYMHTYGAPSFECWSWWLVKKPKAGAIATIGNTGYGYGILAEYCTTGGLDNWITTEFFVQYGTNGFDILGEAHKEVVNSYWANFGQSDNGDVKSVQQWVLLGDPSLKIGGYPSQKNVKIAVSGDPANPGQTIQLNAVADAEPISYNWDLDSDGNYDDATGKTVSKSWNDPGVYWVSVKTTYDNNDEETSTTIVEIDSSAPAKPTKPFGPNQVTRGQTNSFSVTPTDADGDLLAVVFDWGDGETSVAGPINSGNTASATHAFTEDGTYKVKVQVYDESGKISEWSSPLDVSVSKSRDRFNSVFFDFLENLMQKFPNAFPMLRELFGL
jgi:hypothetical protein